MSIKESRSQHINLQLLARQYPSHAKKKTINTGTYTGLTGSVPQTIGLYSTNQQPSGAKLRQSMAVLFKALGNRAAIQHVLSRHTGKNTNPQSSALSNKALWFRSTRKLLLQTLLRSRYLKLPPLSNYRSIMRKKINSTPPWLLGKMQYCGTSQTAHGAHLVFDRKSSGWAITQ